jgi:hypothetical protein
MVFFSFLSVVKDGDEEDRRVETAEEENGKKKSQRLKLTKHANIIFF